MARTPCKWLSITENSPTATAKISASPAIPDARTPQRFYGRSLERAGGCQYSNASFSSKNQRSAGSVGPGLRLLPR
jgi:hypothetical protein